MHVSAIGPSRNFKGYDDDIIDAEYREIIPAGKRQDSLDSVDFQAVSRTLDRSGANRKTSPAKFFVSSAALALAAFVASRAACGAAFNKLDSKFGMFESMGKKAGEALVQYVEKHPPKEGKGFGIYFSNKMHDLAQGIINYGKKGLSAETLSKLEGINLAKAAAGEAIKKGTSAALGVGVAGATIQSRYKDEDKNGVPDKAEGKLSVVKEVASLVPALVEAAGL